MIRLADTEASAVAPDGWQRFVLTFSVRYQGRSGNLVAVVEGPADGGIAAGRLLTWVQIEAATHMVAERYRYPVASLVVVGCFPIA